MKKVDTVIIGFNATSIAIASELLRRGPRQLIVVVETRDSSPCWMVPGVVSVAFTHPHNILMAKENERRLVQMAASYKMKRLLKRNKLLLVLKEGLYEHIASDVARKAWKRLGVGHKLVKHKELSSKWHLSSEKAGLEGYHVISTDSISYHKCVLLRELLHKSLEASRSKVMIRRLEALRIDKDGIDLTVYGEGGIKADTVIVADEYYIHEALDSLGFEGASRAWRTPVMVTEPLAAQRMPNMYIEGRATVNYAPMAELIVDLMGLTEDPIKGHEEDPLDALVGFTSLLDSLVSMVSFLGSIRMTGLTKDVKCISSDGSPLIHHYETEEERVYLVGCYGGREDSLFLPISSAVVSHVLGSGDYMIGSKTGIAPFTLYSIDRFYEGRLLEERLSFIHTPVGS